MMSALLYLMIQSQKILHNRVTGKRLIISMKAYAPGWSATMGPGCAFKGTPALDPSNYLTRKEACRFLAVSRATFYRLKIGRIMTSVT